MDSDNVMAARIFGGEPTDHVTFGRMAAFGSSALVLTATAIAILARPAEIDEVAHRRSGFLAEGVEHIEHRRRHVGADQHQSARFSGAIEKNCHLLV